MTGEGILDKGDFRACALRASPYWYLHSTRKITTYKQPDNHLKLPKESIFTYLTVV